MHTVSYFTSSLTVCCSDIRNKIVCTVLVETLQLGSMLTSA